jgi:hypothetical protein
VLMRRIIDDNMAITGRIAFLERQVIEEKAQTASVKRRLSEERARTTTENRNADATTQDAAADIVTVAPEKKAGPISNAEKQGDTPEEASDDNDAKQEHLKKIRDRTKAVNDRITSLERELDEVTAQTTSKKRKSKKRKSKKRKSNEKTDQSTTGDRNADTTIQDAAADNAESQFSAENAPLQRGLPQLQRLEPDVPVKLKKKKPEAGPGRVRRRAE